ncbi:methyltransferase [Fodinicurvata sp. EGI_FJ10296]|uniref:methyltransferase n=1 Tax=Fodinicurvata sp. EGI_FJ10296 TaxID=3231908 RepID=UPI003452DFA3
MHFDGPWSSYASLTRIIGSVVDVWPQHQSKLARDFSLYGDRDRAMLDSIAADILSALGGDVREAAGDYRWTCSRMLDAEMRFRRDGSSANASVDDLLSGIYGSKDDTKRYMNGLLLSQILWPQHAGPLLYFRSEYLASVLPGAVHLEIGPGHGLWMAGILQRDSSAQLVGWDITRECLSFTESTFQRLCPDLKPRLEIRDICDNTWHRPSTESEGLFDSVIASQLFEVVSEPKVAALNIHRSLAPSGRTFICSPINVAAPDHLRRWMHEDDLLAVLRSAGLHPTKLLRFGNQPGAQKIGAGYSLVVEAARSNVGETR